MLQSYEELSNFPIEDTRARMEDQVQHKKILEKIGELKKSIDPLSGNRTDLTVSKITLLEKKLISEPKKMTSVTLHDLITELYESKVKSDLKNLDARAPRKTME